MTQQELRDSTQNLIHVMVAYNCYVKGYGDKFRVMKQDHVPYKNISKLEMKVLTVNNIIERTGLIWVLSVSSNPFKDAIEIKLPEKEL